LGKNWHKKRTDKRKGRKTKRKEGNLKKEEEINERDRNAKIYSNICPTRCSFTQFLYIWKLLYMFRVLPPPIIR